MSSPRYSRCEHCGKNLEDDFAVCTFCSAAFCSPDCLWLHYTADHPKPDEQRQPERAPPIHQGRDRLDPFT